jgi:hypothetical protein
MTEDQHPDDDNLVVPPLVSSDDKLPEGYPPFTAYGHLGYGYLDTRVLEQDVVWVDIRGKPRFLIDMPEGHLRDVIGFLHRNAHEWWQRAILFDSLQTAFLHTVDEAEEAATAQAHRRRLLDQGPTEWIESTPLMRRLLELAEGDEHA